MKRTALLTAIAILTITTSMQAWAGPSSLRYSISVTKFENEASWRGKWDLGNGFTTIMTDVLNETDQFIVLGDAEMRNAALAEQDFAASGRTAGGRLAPQTGRMTPAQLLVRGSITHVQETAGGRGGLNFRGISVGGSRASAEVNITIYLVETVTGQVKASQKVTGRSGKRGVGVGYYGSRLGGLTGNLSGFTDDNVGQAVENAVSEAVSFLIAQLDEIPWEAAVVMVRDGQVIINRGSRDGISQGMLFRVGQAEQLIDPDTGELLDSFMKTIADIEVSEVRDRVAYCRVLSGQGVDKGMTVLPK